MNLHGIFPTPVGIVNIGRDFTDSEKFFFLNLPQHSNIGNSTSNDVEVLSRPEMTKINEFVDESVQSYLTAVYAPKHQVRLRITQSWCNYTKPGQYHHKHNHPNSFVSGVLYLQTEDTDRIHFYKENYEQIKFSTDNLNIYNAGSWWLEAVTGRLILFPSSLMHMVNTVKTEGTRISLSFNTFPVGHVGDDGGLTGLYLEK